MNRYLFKNPGDLIAVKIAGTDAFDFLQGQLSNDLNSIEKDNFGFGAWCDPKGRVLVNFILFSEGSDYVLIFSAAIADSILARLRMFVLRADVTITSLENECTLLGVIDEETAKTFADHRQSAFKKTKMDTLSYLFMDASHNRFLVFGEDHPAKALPGKDIDAFEEADSMAWQSYDIKAGIPWINQSTTGQYLPQELNLDMNTGLSYEKGCFPGQEIIARLHYRGAVKKRLFSAHVLSTSKITSAISDGMKLRRPDSASTVGTVLNTAIQNNEVHILAVADTSISSDDLIILENGSEVKLTPHF